MSTTLLDDESILCVVHNPLWPSAHSGFLYTPLDASWRAENTEWFQGLLKLNTGLTVYMKDISKLNSSFSPSQTTSEVGEQLFGESAGFVQSAEEKKKEPESGQKFLIQYQIRILENLQTYLADYYQAEIVRNQTLTNMSQARLMNIQLTPDQEFGIQLINTYVQYLDQRELALKSFYNQKQEFNQLYLETMQKTLINCVENSLKYLKFYPGTSYSTLPAPDRRYFFPQVEHHMLRFPVLRPFLFYQLYLANVLRQLGNVDDALIIYKNLLCLSTPQLNQTIPSIFTMMGAQNQTKNQLTNQQFDFPDVRVPYICCLLQAGRGQELMSALESGSKAHSEEDQTYMNNNFCRAQKYFGSTQPSVDFEDEEYFRNKYPMLQKSQLTQRYQEALATANYCKNQLKIATNCVCCHGKDVLSKQQEETRYGRFIIADFGKSAHKIKFTDDEFEVIGQNGVEQAHHQHSNKNLQRHQPEQVLKIYPPRTFLKEKLHVEPPLVNYDLPLKLDPFGTTSNNKQQTFESVLDYENQVIGETQSKFQFEQLPLLKANKKDTEYIKINRITCNSYQTKQQAKMGYRMVSKYVESNKQQKNKQLNESPDYKNILQLIKVYQNRTNPYIYQSPISRFISFGAYMNIEKLDTEFGFESMRQLQTSQSEIFSSIPNLEFFSQNQIYKPLSTSTALYTYVLSLINKRVIWANRIAKILYKDEKFSKCSCGLASHSIGREYNTAQMATGAKYKCGMLDQNQAVTRLYLDQLMDEYPPPKLPSIQLIYLAFQSNPLIVEYLLGTRRLPDIASMRQLFIGFGDASEGQTEKKQNNLNKTPNLALCKQQQQSMEASLYVSDFGHFWQSDDLTNDIIRTSIKLQIINDGPGMTTTKLHYYSLAQSQIFSCVDSFIQYSALDFIHLAYLQFIDYELKKLLMTQIQLNNNHIEQMMQLYQQNHKQEEFDESLSFTPFYYDKNQFGTKDTLLNLQTTDMFKSNLYVHIFEKHFMTLSTDIRQMSYYEQELIPIQRQCSRFLGDLLQVFPNLQCFQILREMTRFIQAFKQQDRGIQEKVQQDYFQIVSQQITKLLPDFQLTLMQKINKVNKDTKKSKDKKDKKVHQDNRADSMTSGVNKTKSQIELEDYTISDDQQQDTLWQLFRNTPALCINFTLNQQIMQQNTITSMQLINSTNVYDPGQIQAPTSSVVQQINQNLICNSNVQNYNQFVQLYKFQYLLLSKYMTHHYDICVFLKDIQTQKQLNIISLNGLDNHLLIFYQILNAMKHHSEQVKQNYENQLKKNNQIDLFSQYYTTLEKETGNYKLDSSFKQPKEIPNNEILSNITQFASFYTHNIYQSYFQSSSGNTQKLQTPTTIPGNIIFASIPPQFMFMYEQFQLNNCSNQQKIQKQDMITKTIDRYISQEMVINYEIQIQTDYLKQLNLFYLSILSNKQDTVYIMLQNYQFGFYELLQGISLAAFACSTAILMLLINFAQGFEEDISVQTLNKLRTNIQSVSQEQIDILKKDPSKKYDVQKIINAHVVMTNYLNNIYNNNAAPIYWRQEQKIQNLINISQDKKHVLEQIQKVQEKITALDQQIDIARQQEYVQAGLQKEDFQAAKEIIMQNVQKEIKQKQELLEAQKDLQKMVKHYDHLLVQNQAQFIFKPQEQVAMSVKTFAEVRTILQNSNAIQFHLLFMLTMYNSTQCSNNAIFVSYTNNLIKIIKL
ncbi:Conserved_hypothetical protein [Hexamita inflata]|uniref:Uncharacterized protein n=1 Tax=Hexamita inflata TaxID=28002 RepID=A0AA86NZA4_9EUKA|nr:Conserved hypothetical protein [Hexamita inflata]